MTMAITMRALQTADIAAVQDLTEAAFEPIFAALAQHMGPHIFAVYYPDWRALQRGLITTFHEDAALHNWVAVMDERPVGLVVYRLNHETKVGVVEFLVVDPAQQNAGVGTALNELALDHLRAAGMQLAEVATGGDPSHAPARRAYEKAGYSAYPQVLYYKYLD